MIESKSISKAPLKVLFESSFIGVTNYQKSVQLQKDLLAQSLNNKVNYILGLEHPAVMTLGYRADLDEEIIDKLSLPIERITRGGLATVHSEGQLIIYPILNLRELKLGVRDYVLLLLTTTQELLKSLGIESYCDKKSIGLYTANGKIAFCGIQIKNGISQHGLSLNVRNDLSLFKKIRACGVENSSFDSLALHGADLPLAEIFKLWVNIFNLNWSSL